MRWRRALLSQSRSSANVANRSFQLLATPGYAAIPMSLRWLGAAPALLSLRGLTEAEERNVMTKIPFRFAISVSTLLNVLLSGCASPPTKDELAALEYGECPQNYEAKIKDEFKGGLLVAYASEPIIWPPQKYWYRAPMNSKLDAGYLVIVMADQTRGAPELLGRKLYGFLFKDDEIIRKLAPTQMYYLGIEEGVGPIPRDEREWTQGFSDGNASQVIVEFVPPGQTVQNWSELVTLQMFRNISLDMLPETVVAASGEMHKNKQPGCAVVSQETLASSPTEMLYAQTLASCAPMRDEYSIRKSIRGPRTISEVSYSTTTEMTEAEKEKWTEIVGRTRLLSSCEPLQ